MRRLSMGMATLIVLAFAANAWAQGTDNPPLTTKELRTTFVQQNDGDESNAFERREMERIAEQAPFAHKNLMKFCAMVTDDPALYGITEVPACSASAMNRKALKLWIKFGDRVPPKKSPPPDDKRG